MGYARISFSNKCCIFNDYKYQDPGNIDRSVTDYELNFNFDVFLSVTKNISGRKKVDVLRY